MTDSSAIAGNAIEEANGNQEVKLPFQFDLWTMVMLIATIAFGLGYFKILGMEEAAFAILVVVAGTLFGGIIGWFFGKIFEAILWGTLGGIFALMCSLTVLYYPPMMHVFWASVGISCGSFLGAIHGILVRTIIVGMAVGFATMIVWAIVLYSLRVDSPLGLYDQIAVVCAGGLFGFLVEAIAFVDRKKILTWQLSLLLLMICVFALNVISLYYIGLNEFKARILFEL